MRWCQILQVTVEGWEHEVSLVGNCVCTVIKMCCATWFAGTAGKHCSHTNTQWPDHSAGDGRLRRPSWNGAENPRRGSSISETAHQAWGPHRGIRSRVSRASFAKRSQQTCWLAASSADMKKLWWMISCVSFVYFVLSVVFITRIDLQLLVSVIMHVYMVLVFQTVLIVVQKV